MVARAREGAIDVGASSLLALFGADEFPTTEQQAGALLLSHALQDLHVLAAGKNYKE